jgi:hypothetical protein
MPSRVCVDINIALKPVLPEVESAKAQTLWAQWVETGTEIVAPPLFLIESTSVRCTQVHRGLITPHETSTGIDPYASRVDKTLVFEIVS